MTTSFPTTGKKSPGYAANQVDEFLERARAQFSDSSIDLVTAQLIRNTQFDLVQGGYATSAVDSAMEKLEDTFAARELERQKLSAGTAALDDRRERIMEILQGRLKRKDGSRFETSGWLLRGYDRKQVDRLCALITDHLRGGVGLEINSLRRAVFRMKRRGYLESQVDAFLDRALEILQIEKNR